MMRTIIQIDGPEHWAPLLAYGSEGDEQLDEMFDCEQWLKVNNLSASDFADADFDSAYIGDFYFASTGPLQCRMVTYTFIKKGSTK